MKAEQVQADHLTIYAAQTCFICELQNCLRGSVSGWFLFFFFFFLSAERKGLSLSFFYIFLEQTTLHRHRYSLVTLQAQMMPGFHGDGGCETLPPASLRSISLPFVFCVGFAFGQARLVGGGGADQYRLAHSRQGLWIPPVFMHSHSGAFSPTQIRR